LYLQTGALQADHYLSHRQQSRVEFEAQARTRGRSSATYNALFQRLQPGQDYQRDGRGRE